MTPFKIAFLSEAGRIINGEKMYLMGRNFLPVFCSHCKVLSYINLIQVATYARAGLTNPAQGSKGSDLPIRAER
jgi:hypothetical protein